MDHPILHDGSKWCDACQQYQSADNFPVVWGTKASEDELYVGQICKMCHDWYLEAVLKEVMRNVEIQERAKKKGKP